MKKIIVILSLLLAPSFVFAISGACSFHNGVNCSTQDPLTGNAICNDGFISSTPYFETDECQATNKSFCTPPVIQDCESAAAAAGEAENNAGGQYDITGSIGAATRVAQCSSNNQGAETAYQNCLNSSNSSQQSSVQGQAAQLMAQIQQDAKDNCYKTYGVNAIFSTNPFKCRCKDGYAFSPNGCVACDAGQIAYEETCLSYQDYCKDIMGTGSTYDTSTGVCSFFTNASLPDATINKQYSQDIHFTYNGSDTPIINFSSADDSLYIQSLHSYGSYGAATLELTPRKAGQFTIVADTTISNGTKYTKTFNLTVDDPNAVTPATPPVVVQTPAITQPPATTQPPVVTQQPIKQISNPPPVEKTVQPASHLTADQINSIRQPFGIPTQHAAKPQTKSNNIFSNIWNFIKNIFK